MRVSVIIPTRDRPFFLEDAVRSVLEQTRSVHEIIVVDDGSKAVHRTEIDHTVSLSPSIRLLRLPESAGVAAARNAGLDSATGDAVLFLDDDDLLHPHMVETGLSILEREPEAGVSTCLYEMFFTPDGEGPWISAALLFNYRILDRHPLRLVDHTNFAPRRLLESRPFSAFLRHLIPSTPVWCAGKLLAPFVFLCICPRGRHLLLVDTGQTGSFLSHDGTTPGACASSRP